jgi:hypothetical protein
MDLTELERKLMAAARAQSPSEQVPFAFEHRVLARLRARPLPDEWALWARALWRAAAPCLAIMLLLGAWSILIPAGASTAGDLSQDLENTVLAAADQEPAPPELIQ